MIKLFKTLPDGRYVFVRDGVYLALTKEQADTIVSLIQEKL